MHLSSASPRGWGGGADVGKYEDFMGTLQQISALVVGECGDFNFWIPYSREECGDFASVQLRGDKKRLIVRSIDGKMVEETKVSIAFLSIKQTIKKTVKNFYVFVGISNFKIPQCIYYFL